MFPVGKQSIMTKISYAGYRFPPVIIQQAIWVSVVLSLSVSVDVVQRQRHAAQSFAKVSPVFCC